jgi:hypothetical protein
MAVSPYFCICNLSVCTSLESLMCIAFIFRSCSKKAQKSVILVSEPIPFGLRSANLIFGSCTMAVSPYFCICNLSACTSLESLMCIAFIFRSCSKKAQKSVVLVSEPIPFGLRQANLIFGSGATAVSPYFCNCNLSVLYVPFSPGVLYILSAILRWGNPSGFPPTSGQAGQSFLY